MRSGRAFSNMKHILFNDYREPAAGKAYEIACEFLEGTGAIREEFETCVFLVQRLTAMVEEGETNPLRMANRAISEHALYVACCREMGRADCTGQPGFPTVPSGEPAP
jgi:hypothetical protein